MKPTCSVPGCERPVYALGLCSRDYQRDRAHGDPEAVSERPVYPVRKNIQLTQETGVEIGKLAHAHRVPEAEIMRRAINEGLPRVPETFKE